MTNVTGHLTSTSDLTGRDLQRLAGDLDGGRLAAHEAAVAAVVRAARRAGVRPVLVDVLADRHQPEVARLRAFGAVATALAAATGAVEARAPRPAPETVAPAA